MTLTKIPTAITKEDRDDALLCAATCPKYVIEDSATREILAQGLTKRQTIEFAWLSDGRDYAVKPRLCALYDDHGQDTGLTTQLVDIFGAEWDVYFKNGLDLPWRKSRITAYGETERAAMLDLIDAGFEREAWSDAFYVHQIGTTDTRKFLAERLQRTAVGAKASWL